MSAADSDIQASCGNVFDDLGLPDAEELRLKSSLVIELRRIITARDMTQTAAAKVLGMGQADLSKLLNGRLRGISVARLMAFLTAFDQDVDITVRPRPTVGEGGRITLTVAPAS